MDEATDIRFKSLERRMDLAETQDLTHNCPQDGCRYMESQGKKPGRAANWLTSVGLLLLLLFEIYGILS